MSIEAEWVSAIAASVGALAIVFVAWQSYLAKKQLDIASEQLRLSAKQQQLSTEQLALSVEQQRISSEHLAVSAAQNRIATKQMEADHERSRRERAIDVLARWTNSLDKAHPSARTLVESFTNEQCQKLKDRKGFKISSEYEDLVKNVLHGYLDEDPPEVQGEELILDDNHASHIYYLCITHLNSLEIALQPWLVNIADEGILETEMQYLVKPEKGYFVLEDLRSVLGGKNCYPAIHEFVEHIKDKKNGGPGRRAKIA